MHISSNNQPHQYVHMVYGPPFMLFGGLTNLGGEVGGIQSTWEFRTPLAMGGLLLIFLILTVRGAQRPCGSPSCPFQPLPQKSQPHTSSSGESQMMSSAGVFKNGNQGRSSPKSRLSVRGWGSLRELASRPCALLATRGCHGNP